MKKIPIVDNTAPKGYQFSSSRNINFYPYEDGKLHLTPGLVQWVECGNGPLRAAAQHKDELLVVSANVLYRVTEDGQVKSVGSLSQATGKAVIVSNGINAMILDADGQGFVYNGVTVSKITDADFADLKPDSLVFHDGYAVVNKPGTGRFYISGSYDFTSWSSLDFATAEGRPDDLVQIVSDKALLWMFGERTLEVWQNTGNADFPFEPLRSAFSHYGAFKNTAVRMDNNIYWLGRDENGGRVVLRLVGGANPQQVSTGEINEWLASISNEEMDKGFGFSVWWRGHAWYCLTFPTVDDFGKTLCFDTTGAWFEWSTYCDSPNAHGRFRGNWQVYYGGRNLVGDSLSGAIYELDGEVYTDGGKRIKRTRRLDTMGADMDMIGYGALQVEMETGTGTPGVDYTMDLRWSDDRGRSWSNSHTRSIGEGGEYSKRVIWRRLGRSRRRTWEINTTAAKDIRINAAYLEAYQ